MQSKMSTTTAQSSEEGRQRKLLKIVDEVVTADLLLAEVDKAHWVEACKKVKEEVHHKFKELTNILKERELVLCIEIEKEYSAQMIKIDHDVAANCVDQIMKRYDENKRVACKDMLVFNSDFHDLRRRLKNFGQLKCENILEHAKKMDQEFFEAIQMFGAFGAEDALSADCLFEIYSKATSSARTVSLMSSASPVEVDDRAELRIGNGVNLKEMADKQFDEQHHMMLRKNREFGVQLQKKYHMLLRNELEEQTLGLQSVPQMSVSDHPVIPSAGQQNSPGTVGVAPSFGTHAPAADPEMPKFIQLRLALLIHAQKCREHENQSNGELRQCRLPNCQSMKRVLSHMTTCQAGESCDVEHCSSSRQIMSHWKKCSLSNCPVCVPLKQAVPQRQQQAAAAVQSSQDPASADMQQTFAALGLPHKAGSGFENINPVMQQSQTVPVPAAAVQTSQGPAPVDIQQQTLEAFCSPSLSQAFGQTQCSPQSLNHIQTSQSSQPNQQSQALRLLQSKVNGTLLNSTPNQVAPIVPGMSPDNLTTSKDWHQSVTPGLRHSLVQRIERAFRRTDISALPDKMRFNLVPHAEQIEVDIYEAANSIVEYHHLIVKKIFNIRKDLAGKRRERKEMEMHQQVGPGLGPILSNNSSATTPKPAQQPPPRPVVQMHNHSRVQSFRHTVVNIKDGDDDYKSVSREGVSSVGQIDTRQNTLVSSTSDQGSVQTGGKVTGESGNSEKRKVEGVKNSVGKQGPVVDVKPSDKPVRSPAPVPSVAKPDSSSESTRPSKRKPDKTKPAQQPPPPPVVQMHNHSQFQSSRHTVINIEDSGDDYKSVSREDVSSVGQIDTRYLYHLRRTLVSSTSDQGSVQTGGKVFSFASEKSTGENGNSEKREIEGVKNSVGKQGPVVDVKPSDKPVRSPAPVPSVGENCVDTKPHSSSESSRPSKHKPYKFFKLDKLQKDLLPVLEKPIYQDPEPLPFRQPAHPQLLPFELRRGDKEDGHDSAFEEDSSCDAKCPVPYFGNIRYTLMQQRQAQHLERRIRTKQNRGMSDSVPSSSPGNSSTTNQLSPGAQSRTSPHPPLPGVGMKQSTGPPVGVLQAVQQVQAAAARQTEPHMVTTAVNYGRGNPVVSPPTPGTILIAKRQQMQAQLQKPVTQILPGVPNRMLGMGNGGYTENPQPHQSPQPTGLRPQSQVMGTSVMSTSMGNTVTTIGSPQVIPNPPGPSLNMLGPTNEAYQQLHQILKPPHSFQQRHLELDLLKSAFPQRAAERQQQQQQQQQMLLNENNVIGRSPQLNVWYEQQQPNQFPHPQPPMYAQHPRMPMPMNFGQQQGFQNDSSRFQQQILMQPQIKQMASLTHPPISAQYSILNHPLGPFSSPSQQPLMQQVRSHPPTAAQADHSPKPIASPKIQANAPQNQPIPSPRQQPTPSPSYPAQTRSPHPSLSVCTSGLSGPDQWTTTSDQGSVRTGGKVFSFASEKSTEENSNGEKIEIEGDKNSIGKQESIVDMKPSGCIMDVKEQPEDDFSASSSLKEEQTVAKEEIASPAPVPSVGENCVDTRPDSSCESTQPSKHKSIFESDESRQALMTALEELNYQDPEPIPFRRPVCSPLLQFDLFEKYEDVYSSESAYSVFSFEDSSSRAKFEAPVKRTFKHLERDERSSTLDDRSDDETSSKPERTDSMWSEEGGKCSLLEKDRQFNSQKVPKWGPNMKIKMVDEWLEQNTASSESTKDQTSSSSSEESEKDYSMSKLLKDTPKRTGMQKTRRYLGFDLLPLNSESADSVPSKEGEEDRSCSAVLLPRKKAEDSSLSKWLKDTLKSSEMQKTRRYLGFDLLPLNSESADSVPSKEGEEDRSCTAILLPRKKAEDSSLSKLLKDTPTRTKMQKTRRYLGFDLLPLNSTRHRVCTFKEGEEDRSCSAVLLPRKKAEDSSLDDCDVETISKNEAVGIPSVSWSSLLFPSGNPSHLAFHLPCREPPVLPTNGGSSGISETESHKSSLSIVMSSGNNAEMKEKSSFNEQPDQESSSYCPWGSKDEGQGSNSTITCSSPYWLTLPGENPFGVIGRPACFDSRLQLKAIEEFPPSSESSAKSESAGIVATYSLGSSLSSAVSSEIKEKSSFNEQPYQESSSYCPWGSKDEEQGSNPTITCSSPYWLTLPHKNPFGVIGRPACFDSRLQLKAIEEFPPSSESSAKSESAGIVATYSLGSSLSSAVSSEIKEKSSFNEQPYQESSSYCPWGSKDEGRGSNPTITCPRCLSPFSLTLPDKYPFGVIGQPAGVFQQVLLRGFQG